MRKKLKEYEVGEKVYIRNETRKYKDEPSFTIKGEIMKKDKNKYWIKTQKGKILCRHSTQIKRDKNKQTVWKGEVGASPVV